MVIRVFESAVATTEDDETGVLPDGCRCRTAIDELIRMVYGPLQGVPIKDHLPTLPPWLEWGPGLNSQSQFGPVHIFEFGSIPMGLDRTGTPMSPTLWDGSLTCPDSA